MPSLQSRRGGAYSGGGCNVRNWPPQNSYCILPATAISFGEDGPNVLVRLAPD